MNKIFTIIKREYNTRVRTKGFIISTVLIPLLFLVGFAIPVIATLMNSEKPQKIAVVDRSGHIFSKLQSVFTDTLKNGERLYGFFQVKAEGQGLNAVKNQLTKEVEAKQIQGFMIIPVDVLDTGKIQYYSKNVSNFSVNERLSRGISGIVNRIRLEKQNLDPALIHTLTKGVKLETFKVTRSGKQQKDAGATFAVTYILVFMLYMAILIYGATLMRSVLEEKTSRVVEVVVSSVSPFKLMAGKILGVGAVSFTQMFIWGMTLFLISVYGVGMAASLGAGNVLAKFHIPPLDPVVLLYFFLFFILGYILYSIFYAAIGAMVNSEQEAGQIQTPIVMLLIIPIMLIIPVISNPDSTLAVSLSLFPFTAPIIMFMRISVLMPPVWQIMLSFVFLGLTIWGSIWVTARIYRVGILMYGKRPNLPELWKWIRY